MIRLWLAALALLFAAEARAQIYFNGTTWRGFPQFKAVGAVAQSINNPSVQAPAGTLVGDGLILACETGNLATLSASESNATWTAWSASPLTTGSTSLYVWTGVATGTGNTVVTQGGTTDHVLCRMTGFKAGTMGLANVQTSNTQAATTSVSINSPTTTRSNCMIVSVSASNVPDAITTTEFGASTNADLANKNERVDNTTSVGTGAALYVHTGERSVPGAIAATTLTAVTSGERANMSAAFCSR